MKTTRLLLLFGAALILMLSACGGPPAPSAVEEPPAVEPAATEAPAEPEPAEAPAEPEPTEEPAAPAEPEPAPAVQHVDIPKDLPEFNGLHLYDHHVNTTYGSIEGDRFYHSRLERPYDTSDKHFAHLDITDVWLYEGDSMWFFAIVAVVGPDSSGALSGKYAIEVDVNLEGHGEWLFLVDNPTSTEWTTNGVQVWRDVNGDVGGDDAIYPDTAGKSGDGYEVMLTDDPDAAWARLSSEYPNAVEVAFKKSLLLDGTKFLLGAWAGTEDLDPALFDLNDHYTHEEAGALNPEYTDFYPIKEVAEIDNTCRIAVGFSPAAGVKGLCP